MTSGLPIALIRRHRRYPRRGVWRAYDPEEGLPRYSIRAIDGEMSLGIGRKRTAEEEEQGLREMQREATVECRTEMGDGTVGSIEEFESRQWSMAGRDSIHTPGSMDRRASESLPPYLPSPAPAYMPKRSGISLWTMSSRRISTGSRGVSRGAEHGEI